MARDTKPLTKEIKKARAGLIPSRETDALEPTNEERAERAHRIIDAYRERHDTGEEDEIVLTDLLADLLHACTMLDGLDNLPLDFDRCLDMARRHFEAERNESLDLNDPRR